jgi:hypothetical protein
MTFITFVHMLAPAGISNLLCSGSGNEYVISTTGVLVDSRDVLALVAAGFNIG